MNQQDLEQQKVDSMVQCDEESKIKHLGKLKSYRFIHDATDIDVGKFVRWIRKDDLASLTMGGHITEIKQNKNDFRIFVYNKYSKANIQVKCNDILLYQKLSDMELLIVSIQTNFGKKK
jgi:hypothetical protein